MQLLPNARLWITLLIGAVALSGQTAEAAEKPNIVFVLFDDLGYGQPGCYNSASELKTPQLDRLASEGMLFTDAHSGAALCTPTRYGILTGRCPCRIGQFGVLTTFSRPIIPVQRSTVASFLKTAGYHTGCVGKWHLGMNWGAEKPGSEKELNLGATMTGGPNALGFDYFCGYTHARNIGSVIEQDRVVQHVEPVDNQPLMIRKAVSFIEQRAAAKDPFFLYFPMCPPHTPVVPAAAYVGKSGGRDVVKKDHDYPDWLYQADAMLGQIMEVLERTGQADNTVLIATSDNGAAGREYPPLRESKASIYEGGHRVPFVARWPGKIKSGSRYDQTVCLTDLFATAADLLQLPLPENSAEDSVSILPALLGQTTGPVREATIHQSGSGDLAIRQGAWKLIFKAGGKSELYNLQSDLGEQKDVASAEPEVVSRLTSLMQSYIDRGRSAPGASAKNDFELNISADRKSKAKAKKAKQKESD